MATFENLNLSDDEEEVLDFQVNQNEGTKADPHLCLVGRFLTKKPIRTYAMKERMASVWQPGKKVAIKEAATGIYLFQFFHKLDMQKVMNGGPWFFDGHLLILGQMGATDLPTQIPLFHVMFWVQVHDIPTGFMSLEVGKGLGNYIGEFIEYDPKNMSSFWRSFMRIRVKVDVRKPLKRSKKISRGGGETKLVKFKYEKLTIFCFLCGLLGHSDSSCEQLFLMEEDNGVRGWGPELRVERRRNGGGGGCMWLCEEVQEAEEMESQEGAASSARNFANDDSNNWHNRIHRDVPNNVGNSSNLITPNNEQLRSGVYAQNLNYTGTLGLHASHNIPNVPILTITPAYVEADFDDGGWRKKERGVQRRITRKAHN